MSDTDTNAAPTSTAATLFQAGLAVATALAQDAEIFASAFGASKTAARIDTGLGATAAVAPSLVNIAALIGAIGTLFHASAIAHAATTGAPSSEPQNG